MIPNRDQFKLSRKMIAGPKTMKSTGKAAPDWDKEYGKSFRLAETPSTAVSGGAAPNTISLVTPYNQDSWTEWPEASDQAKTNFKSNWGNIWESSGGYKQRQILKASRKIAKKENQK